MDYTNEPLGLETPKICCIPARPLVCFLAVLGIIRGSVLIWVTANWGEIIPDIIFLGLNALLLYGAARNNEPALKWSQRVVFLCVLLAGIQFLIWPVMFASFTASGMADKNRTKMMDLSDDLFKKDDEEKKMFARGLLTGYAVELGALLLIGAEVLKYVLVNRLWKYAKSTENIGGNHYIVP